MLAFAQIGLFGKNEAQADTIVSPAHGARHDLNGTFGHFIAATGALQRHENQRSWVPALLSDHIETAGADVANIVGFRGGSVPVIGRQAQCIFSRSFAGIGRPPAFEPVLGRAHRFDAWFDEAHLVRLRRTGGNFHGAVSHLDHSRTAAPKRVLAKKNRALDDCFLFVRASQTLKSPLHLLGNAEHKLVAGLCLRRVYGVCGQHQDACRKRD